MCRFDGNDSSNCWFSVRLNGKVKSKSKVFFVIFVFNMKLIHAVVLIVLLHFFIDIGQVGEYFSSVLAVLFYRSSNQYFSIAEDAATLPNSENRPRKRPKKEKTALEKCMKNIFKSITFHMILTANNVQF